MAATMVSVGELRRGLELAKKAISRRSSLPILLHVHLVSDRNSLSLNTTDLELGVRTIIAASGQAFALCVPHAHLYDFIKGLGKQERVSLSCEQLDSKAHPELSVECGASKVTIQGIAAEDFPPGPELGESHFLQLGCDQFIEAFDACAYAASRDEARPVLTAVLLSFKLRQLDMVGTNGHQLVGRDEIGYAGERLEANLLVPSRVADLLLKGFRGQELIGVGLTKARNLIYFTSASSSESQGVVRITSRLIDGRYPNYRQVVPELAGRLEVRVERKPLAEALKRAKIMARDAANVIRIHVEPQATQLRLRADTKQQGQAEEQVACQLKGELAGELRFGVNASYLAGQLDLLASEEISMWFDGPLSPVVIADGDQRNFGLIMPARVA